MKKLAVFSAVLMCAAFVAHADQEWTFDCSDQDWIVTTSHSMAWDNTGGEGKVLLTYVDPGEDPFDPVFQCPSGRAIDFNATPQIIIEFEATGMPADYGCAVSVFTADGADAWRYPFDAQEGTNRIVIDAATVDWADIWVAEEGNTPTNQIIDYFRFDLPDGPGYADIADATITVDFVAVSANADLVPVQDTADCAAGALWRNLVINRLDTAPVMDGTVTAAEYPTTPLPITQELVDVFGGHLGSSVDDTDLSGTFYLGWDANYLYCAAQVTDDVVVYNADQGDALNVTDGIQLCTDHLYLRGGAVGSDDGLLIHDLAPGQASDNNTAAYYQHWPGDDGSQTQTISDVANDIAGRTVTGGYEVEMRIPWANFTPSAITPEVGTLIGYVAIIMDFESADLKDLVYNSADAPWAGAGAAGWNTGILAGPEGDVDGDGLSDEDEAIYGSDPEDPDTDGDTLSDGDEVHLYGTDPLLVDTDDDGVSDPLELMWGSDPTDPLSVPGLPVAGYAAIGLLVVLLAGAGVVLTLRLRKRLS